MQITIIGTGYVGLVTGACLSDLGNNVICFDINNEKIDKLNRGIIPIYEPGLEPLIQHNYKAHRLSFTTDIVSALEKAEVIFIAVGTPPNENGAADLQYVLSAAHFIGKYLQCSATVIDKSTVPVGTAFQVKKIIQQELERRNVHTTFHIVSNPEFLKEGAAVEDFMRPDRIVIGAENAPAFEVMRTLYAPLQRNHQRMIEMDIISAELTKYAANAMLATRISFMNELANLAEKVGADIEQVRLGIGSDPRIGYHFLYAGCGYGGSCFPKDVTALVKTANEHNQQLHILDAVSRVNASQKLRLQEKIQQRFGNNINCKHFALWGLAFKPNTDDMRDAPSRIVIDFLIAQGATIAAFDPEAIHEAKYIYANQSQIQFVSEPMDALNDAIALIIVTEWKEFKSPSFSDMKTRLKSPIIFDGRNLYSPKVMLKEGFEYYGIGRQQITPKSVVNYEAA